MGYILIEYSTCWWLLWIMEGMNQNQEMNINRHLAENLKLSYIMNSEEIMVYQVEKKESILLYYCSPSICRSSGNMYGRFSRN